MSDPVPLEDELASHAPAGPDEARDLERIRAFVERKADPFDREDTEGHVVASGLVTSPELDQVVLLHHAALDMWLQTGGHAQPGERSGHRIARREAVEETGFAEIEPHPQWPDLIDVDVHEIPATDAMPAHLHLDLRYLFVADPSLEPTVPEDEAHQVRWFDVETARQTLDLDPGLQRLLWKVRSLRIDAGHEAETVEPRRRHEPT